MRLTPDQWIARLGVEAYRVGGSVRDELLGRHSKDSDYMVRGLDMEALGARLHGQGGKISKLQLRGGGVQIGWRVKAKDIGVLEIVLPRSERSTGSGRHDFVIEVDPLLPLHADARRRDFTINSLYKNVATGEILDPTGFGLRDMEDRAISTTHESSFTEDPLRILRALRFVSKLPGFTLYDATYRQMREHAMAVTGLTQKGVSGTALDELSGILMGNNPGHALRLMRDTGVMRVFLPELHDMCHFEQRSRYHDKNTDEHTFDAVHAAAQMHGHAPLHVRMALLFHDAGKPVMAWTGKDGLQHYYALSPADARELGAGTQSTKDHEFWSAKLANEALNRLNAPNALKSKVNVLIERHMMPLHENLKPFKVRKWRTEIGDELLRDLITHRTCDVIGKGGDISEQLEVLEWIAAEQQRAIDNNVPASVLDLAIGGRVIADLGARGPMIGEIQRVLLHEVISQPRLNETDWLKARAEKLVAVATIGDRYWPYE